MIALAAIGCKRGQASGLDEFLDAFPTVSREQALAGLEAAILLTGDQNLQFQQNLATRRLGAVVLCAASNAIEDLLPLVPAARRGRLEITGAAQAGNVDGIEHHGSRQQRWREARQRR